MGDAVSIEQSFRRFFQVDEYRRDRGFDADCVRSGKLADFVTCLEETIDEVERRVEHAHLTADAQAISNIGIKDLKEVFGHCKKATGSHLEGNVVFSYWHLTAAFLWVISGLLQECHDRSR